MSQRKQISEQVFTDIAKKASDCNCLKGRDGDFGKEFGIFLNGHLVMKSIVLESGERVYYSYLD